MIKRTLPYRETFSIRHFNETNLLKNHTLLYYLRGYRYVPEDLVIEAIVVAVVVVVSVVVDVVVSNPSFNQQVN